MNNLTNSQMEGTIGGKIDASCAWGLAGMAFCFAGIFCISGPFGAAVWYGGTMCAAMGTGLSC